VENIEHPPPQKLKHWYLVGKYGEILSQTLGNGRKIFIRKTELPYSAQRTADFPVFSRYFYIIVFFDFRVLQLTVGDFAG
jgi:hypothetical protein